MVRVVKPQSSDGYPVVYRQGRDNVSFINLARMEGDSEQWTAWASVTVTDFHGNVYKNCYHVNNNTTYLVFAGYSVNNAATACSSSTLTPNSGQPVWPTPLAGSLITFVIEEATINSGSSAASSLTIYFMTQNF